MLPVGIPENPFADTTDVLGLTLTPLPNIPVLAPWLDVALAVAHNSIGYVLSVVLTF